MSSQQPSMKLKKLMVNTIQKERINLPIHKPITSPFEEKVHAEFLKKKEKEQLVPFLKEEINHPPNLTSSPFEEKVQAKSKKIKKKKKERLVPFLKKN